MRVLLALVLVAFSSNALAAELQVKAGDFPRASSVIRAELSAELLSTDKHQLHNPQTGQTVAAQRDGNSLVFIIDEPLPAGSERTYQWKPAETDSTPRQTQMRCEKTSGRIDVWRDEQLVFSYHTGESTPPDGIDPIYARSGHIHPIRTPNGLVVTDEFPADHPHQHGLFSAWVRTRYDGHLVDFWNQAGKTGTVEHRAVLGTQDGPVLASLSVQQASIDLTDAAHPRDVLHETWNLRCYNTSPGPVFEIVVQQNCAEKLPLHVLEYHYGGMAIRGAGSWLNQPEHDFLTSEGLTRANGNHSRPDWVCMQGLVKGRPCGIAVFCHPDNFRAPQPVRLHPQKPYFVFTPPVLGEFEITPDQPYQARYLYYAFDGQPDPDELNRIWIDYAHPVQTVWIN